MALPRPPLRSLLLLGLPVVLAWTWTTLSGYHGLNGQDSYDYLRIARGWTAWAHGGPLPQLFEHPHGYPMAGALLGALIGSEALALRLISAGSLLVIAFTFRGLLRRTFPRQREQVDAFVLLALVAVPFLLRLGVVVMSDVPGIALVCMAFACTVRWITEQRVSWLIGAALAAALAIAVRFAAAPLVLLMAVAIVHGPRQGRRLRWGLALSALAVGAVLAFALLPMDRIRTLLAHSPLGDWSALDLFRRELRSDDGVLRYRVPNMIYVLGIAVHPGFLPIGALLLPFIRRADLRPPHARLAAVLVGCYLFFIAGMPFQNDRVLLLAQPFMAVLLFPAFTRALTWVQARGVRSAWAVLGLVVVQAGLFVRATLPFIHQARTEQELAAEVNALHPRRVYTHGMGAAFNTLCPGTPVTELWYGAIDRFEPGALIVVRPQNLTEQWLGHPPAINWERAQAQGVDTLLLRPDGWTIARVR